MSNNINSSLVATLGNIEWVKENEQKLKDLLPETWTHLNNINMLKIGFNLKLLGVDWRSREELVNIMTFFEKFKLLQRDAYLVRRNPYSVFNQHTKRS